MVAREGKRLTHLATGAVALAAMAAGAVVLGIVAIGSFRFHEGEIDCLALNDLTADRLCAPEQQPATLPSKPDPEMRSGVAGANMIGNI